MATTDSLPMIPEFPRWLATTVVGRDDARQSARWAAVSTLARNIDDATAETLLRLALKSRQQAASPYIQKIREAFYATDNTFEMNGNDRELQILAGSTLAAVLTLSGDAPAYTATEVAAAMIDGNRKPNIPMDLSALSTAAIDRLAETSRKRPRLSSLAPAEATKLDFAQAAAKGKEGNWQSVSEAFALAASSTRNAIETITSRQTELAQAIDTYLRVQDEELEMLWWLVGARSTDMGCRLDAVNPDFQPLLFAKELADLTSLLPGPRSVRALMSRAGLKDRKKTSVKDAINAPDAAWLETFIPDADLSPVTTPIHFGIKRRLETGPGDAWIAGWAAATELSVDLALRPLTMSLHFYRERLLVTFAD